jgi:hypothetical protein
LEVKIHILKYIIFVASIWLGKLGGEIFYICGNHDSENKIILENNSGIIKQSPTNHTFHYNENWELSVREKGGFYFYSLSINSFADSK